MGKDSMMQEKESAQKPYWLETCYTCEHKWHRFHSTPIEIYDPCMQCEYRGVATNYFAQNGGDTL